MKRLTSICCSSDRAHGGAGQAHGQTAPFDAVIRNGTILDGSGNPRFEADIAIRNGFIVAIGNVAGTATEEIDAKGLFVAPGFINIHSHASRRRAADRRQHADAGRDDGNLQRRWRADRSTSRRR